MKYIIYFYVIFVANNVMAFEVDRWPGEGMPIVSFKSKNVNICLRPVLGSTCRLVEAIPNKKILFSSEHSSNIESGFKYIQSKTITVKSVKMVVKNEFDIAGYGRKCSKGKINLKKDETINNLAYEAEGYYFLEIRGSVCSVFLDEYSEHLLNSHLNPEQQWWAKFEHLKTGHIGWIHVTRNNFNFLDRSF